MIMNTWHHRIASTTAAIAVLLGTAMQAQAFAPAPTEYVKNGNFETGSDNGEFCYLNATSCTVSDWSSAGGGTVNIDSNSGAWNNPSALAGWSPDGLGHVIGLQGTTTFSQNLTLPSSGTYHLSWVDAGRNAAPTLANPVNALYTVSFAGALLNTFTVNIGQSWQSHGLDFFADGPGLLQFAGINQGGDGTAFIDRVSVTSAVPEPETYAMLLAGLGALGFMGRRRAPRHVA
jgi:hypothetical protein